MSMPAPHGVTPPLSTLPVPSQWQQAEQFVRGNASELVGALIDLFLACLHLGVRQNDFHELLSAFIQHGSAGGVLIEVHTVSLVFLFDRAVHFIDGAGKPIVCKPFELIGKISRTKRRWRPR